MYTKTIENTEKPKYFNYVLTLIYKTKIPVYDLWWE